MLPSDETYCRVYLSSGEDLVILGSGENFLTQWLMTAENEFVSVDSISWQRYTDAGHDDDWPDFTMVAGWIAWGAVVAVEDVSHRMLADIHEAKQREADKDPRS